MNYPKVSPTLTVSLFCPSGDLSLTMSQVFMALIMQTKIFQIIQHYLILWVINILLFRMKSRIQLPESNLSNIFIRAIPIELEFKRTKKIDPHKKYRIFLERGLQVMGKSAQSQPLTPSNIAKFNLTKQENYFDFQTINEKNLNYDFVLYEIDQQQNQQRIELQRHDLTANYAVFKRKGFSEFDNQITFANSQATLKWKLLINNVSNTITMLANRLLKKSSSSAQIEREQYPYSKGLKRIEEQPSEENVSSKIRPNDGFDRVENDTFHEFKTYAKTQSNGFLPQIKQTSPPPEQEVPPSKTKKVALIIMIMVLLLGLMGSGILPITKLKGKKKPKNKY